jgi:hypothetical protein
VYVKKVRKAQEYMIRYDNGESMRGVEEHLVPAQDDGMARVRLSVKRRETTWTETVIMPVQTWKKTLR